MKTIFIPGLGERKKDYLNRKWLFERCVDIDWNNIKVPKKADVVISFSLGIVLAVNIKCDLLILCSPTPIIFDINKVKAKSIIFVSGDKEDVSHNKQLYRNFNGNKGLMIVPNTGHKITKRYEEIIKSFI